jgi:hypothetical protein
MVFSAGVAACSIGLGCRRETAPPVDRAKIETASSEAVLRRVVADADESARKAGIGIIVLGPRLEDTTPEFRNRLADVGIPWVSSLRMTQVWVGQTARVIDRETKLQPLQLQIAAVEARPDGSQETIAGWAFGERMERRRYLARSRPDGTWEIERLELIDQKP